MSTVRRLNRILVRFDSDLAADCGESRFIAPIMCFQARTAPFAQFGMTCQIAPLRQINTEYLMLQGRNLGALSNSGNGPYTKGICRSVHSLAATMKLRRGQWLLGMRFRGLGALQFCSVNSPELVV